MSSKRPVDAFTSAPNRLSTVDFRAATPVNKVVRKKPERKALYPYFEECSKLTSDPYWIAIFSNAARGKMPRKFTYKNGVLSYKRGNRFVHLTLPSLPYEGASACIDFFNKNGGLMSELDSEKHQESRNLLDSQSSDDPENRQWKSFTRRTKDILIDDYIYRMSEKYKLTPAEEQQLRYCINIAGIRQLVNNNTVEMYNQQIRDITILEYDTATRVFSITAQPGKNRAPARKSRRTVNDSGDESEHVDADMSARFLKKWQKYIKQLGFTPSANTVTVRKPKNNIYESLGSLMTTDTNVGTCETRGTCSAVGTSSVLSTQDDTHESFSEDSLVS